MLDRTTRAEAFLALRRFVFGDITNDDYESEYPLPELFGRKASSDRAIRAIYEMSWSWFDDFHSHKLEGEYALDDETRRVAHRCLLFLQSDVEYRWKETRFIKAGTMISNLLTLGLTRTRLSLEEQLAAHLDQPDGDAFAWPFYRREELEAAASQFPPTQLAD